MSLVEPRFLVRQQHSSNFSFRNSQVFYYFNREITLSRAIKSSSLKFYIIFNDLRRWRSSSGNLPLNDSTLRAPSTGPGRVGVRMTCPRTSWKTLFIYYEWEIDQTYLCAILQVNFLEKHIRNVSLSITKKIIETSSSSSLIFYELKLCVCVCIL